jgi:hypothetical protein
MRSVLDGLFYKGFTSFTGFYWHLKTFTRNCARLKLAGSIPGGSDILKPTQESNPGIKRKEARSGERSHAGGEEIFSGWTTLFLPSDLLFFALRSFQDFFTCAHLDSRSDIQMGVDSNAE